MSSGMCVLNYTVSTLGTIHFIVGKQSRLQYFVIATQADITQDNPNLKEAPIKSLKMNLKNLGEGIYALLKQTE